jgi:hypothetical protein
VIDWRLVTVEALAVPALVFCLWLGKLSYMPTDPMNCPHCNSADVFAIPGHPAHVVCEGCGARGPDGLDVPHAVKLWNQRWAHLPFRCRFGIHSIVYEEGEYSCTRCGMEVLPT